MKPKYSRPLFASRRFRSPNTRACLLGGISTGIIFCASVVNGQTFSAQDVATYYSTMDPPEAGPQNTAGNARDISYTPANATPKTTLEALAGFKVIRDIAAAGNISSTNTWILNATDPLVPDLALSYFVGPNPEDVLAATSFQFPTNTNFQTSLGSAVRVHGLNFNSEIGLRIEAGSWDGDTTTFTSGGVAALAFTVVGPIGRAVNDTVTVVYYGTDNSVLSTQEIVSAVDGAGYTGLQVTTGPLIKHATVSWKGGTSGTVAILAVDDIAFAPNPSSIPTPVKWAVGDGDWDTATTNWQPLAGGASTTYEEGASVTFDDTASGTSPITVNMVNTRTPATIDVNGSKNYVFANENGEISGGGSLTKAGTGSLTLETDNTFTGVTTLTGGTIKLDSSGALQNSAVTLNGGSLLFDATAATTSDFILGNLASAQAGPGYDLALQNSAGATEPINLTIGSSGLSTTYAGVLSGPGSLFKDGAGILTLSNSNTFTGDTTLLGTGALRLTNADALGTTGTLNLLSNQTAPGVTTFEISGGINFSRPIVIDSTTGREHFTSTGGANTLSSTIDILNGGTNVMSLDAGGAPGNLFTVSGAINANDPNGGAYIGALFLRGTGGGLITSVIDGPSMDIELLQTANNVVWTIASTGNVWDVTRITSGTGPLVDGANQGFSGCKLVIGANDALAPTARIHWNNTNNNIASATVDLAGFNQTVAGLDKPGVNASQPLPNTTPPTLPPVPNSIPNVTNSSTTSDSTLTIANIVADNAVTAPFYAHAYSGRISDGPSRKLSLVYDSLGKNQGLTGAAGFLSYTGDTTIKLGTLTVVNPNFADSSTLKIGENPGDDAVLNLPSAGTDTVAVLVIDGQTFTTGEFGALLSGAATETDAITGSGRINVQPFVASPYDNWVASFQPGFTLDLPEQDQDGDGLTNQQEFAFGLNPKSGASVSPIIGGLSANGQFSYTRLSTSGLTYKVFTSTTLGSWAEDVAATNSQVPGPVGPNNVQSVAVTLTATPENGKLFVRVQAD